ncbi:recombinase family protein, partial [Bacillus cereus]|nr:recombinase family protein [Bacillus cereus]
MAATGGAIRAQHKIKAIGYIRQSDEREDKEDISEKTQLTKIEQYCELNDWELV